MNQPTTAQIEAAHAHGLATYIGAAGVAPAKVASILKDKLPALKKARCDRQRAVCRGLLGGKDSIIFAEAPAA